MEIEMVYVFLVEGDILSEARAQIKMVYVRRTERQVETNFKDGFKKTIFEYMISKTVLTKSSLNTQFLRRFL